jgi:hypothetical protein
MGQDWNVNIQRGKSSEKAGEEKRADREMYEKQSQVGKVYFAGRLVLKFSKLSFSCLRTQFAKARFVFGAWLHSRKFWWTLARHRRSHGLDDRMCRRPQPPICVASGTVKTKN